MGFKSMPWWRDLLSGIVLQQIAEIFYDHHPAWHCAGGGLARHASVPAGCPIGAEAVAGLWFVVWIIKREVREFVGGHGMTRRVRTWRGAASCGEWRGKMD